MRTSGRGQHAGRMSRVGVIFMSLVFFMFQRKCKNIFRKMSQKIEIRFEYVIECQIYYVNRYGTKCEIVHQSKIRFKCEIEH